MACAMSFMAPERYADRFHLDGFDSGWVDTDARGDRTFTQLPGGDFTLHVQAAGPCCWSRYAPCSTPCVAAKCSWSMCPSIHAALAKGLALRTDMAGNIPAQVLGGRAHPADPAQRQCREVH